MRCEIPPLPKLLSKKSGNAMQFLMECSYFGMQVHGRLSRNMGQFSMGNVSLKTGNIGRKLLALDLIFCYN